jgi:hypothetical protein
MRDCRLLRQEQVLGSGELDRAPYLGSPPRLLGLAGSLGQASYGFVPTPKLAPEVDRSLQLEIRSELSSAECVRFVDAGP